MINDKRTQLSDIFASLADILLRQAEASTTMLQAIAALSTSEGAIRPIVADLTAELQIAAEHSGALTNMLAEVIRADHFH